MTIYSFVEVIRGYLKDDPRAYVPTGKDHAVVIDLDEIQQVSLRDIILY
jgi:hypothetical protein